MNKNEFVKQILEAQDNLVSAIEDAITEVIEKCVEDNPDLSAAAAFHGSNDWYNPPEGDEEYKILYDIVTKELDFLDQLDYMEFYELSLRDTDAYIEQTIDNKLQCFWL